MQPNQHQCWGRENVSLEADAQVTFSSFFLLYGVWMAVPTAQQAQQSIHLAEGLTPLQLNFVSEKESFMHLLLSKEALHE